MAIYYARKAGNINASDVWATTPTGAAGDVFGSFTSNDTLMSNNFAITINVNTTVLEIRNDAYQGATAGGLFILTNEVTLIANIYGGASTNGVCVDLPSTAISATIIGNLTGGSFTNCSAARNSNAIGILNIIGNVIGGNANLAGAHGVTNSSNGTVNITGNVTGGSANACHGVNNSSNGSINITGNVIGGSNSSCFGANNASIGTITIVGISIASNVAPGSNNGNTGTLTVTRAKGNGFGNGSVGLNSVVGVNSVQNATTYVYEIEYGDLGQSPTAGPVQIIDDISNIAIFAIKNSAPKSLVDINNSGNLIPSANNVRSGVAYNYNNNIGSCIIPHPNSVVYGVSVDNTFGSGLLSPKVLWDVLTSSIQSSGSIGERLKNVATIASVGKQLESIF